MGTGRGPRIDRTTPNQDQNVTDLGPWIGPRRCVDPGTQDYSNVAKYIRKVSDIQSFTDQNSWTGNP